jgi:hypothetical protein
VPDPNASDVSDIGGIGDIGKVIAVAVTEAARAAQPKTTATDHGGAFEPGSPVVRAALRPVGLTKHVERVTSTGSQCRVYPTPASLAGDSEEPDICTAIAAILRVLWNDGDRRVQVFANAGTDLRYVTIERAKWHLHPPLYRTATEWCAHHRVQVTDADGWRGSPCWPGTTPLPAKDFDSLITCEEFQARLAVSTVGYPQATSAELEAELTWLTQRMLRVTVARLHTERPREVLNHDGMEDAVEMLVARGLVAAGPRGGWRVTRFGAAVSRAMWFAVNTGMPIHDAVDA